ncbi:MAG: peptidase M41 [Crocinitomicaceae bacterium]|nr:peptidase M41 [Crocinitomicaceae bacterium]|tara:strand:+ start:2619 stop:4760 length:2142 start_codon:yes stop_codon:yes gene_type:complete
MSENKQKAPGNKRPPLKKPKKTGNNFNFYWIYAIIGVFLIGNILFSYGPSQPTINPIELQRMVDNNDVRKIIIINKETAKIYLSPEALQKEEYKQKIKDGLLGKSGQTGPHFEMYIGTPEQFGELLAKWSQEKDLTYEYRTEKNWGEGILGWLLPIAIMVGIWLFILRRMGGGGGPGGQIFNIGKSKAKLFDENDSVKITFDDVAGQEEAKEEVKEIVDFLQNPKRYTNLGARIPKGALLVGAPGTGKTLLAKAVAGEAQVPFFSLSGSDFVEMFVGVGASRVRDLFKQAKEKSPSIIFIDEIDAIGRARGKNPMQGSNDERENTLNQLLTEMDGFGSNTGVIILAATNRADVLDKALLRPGRFDRQIIVDMPDLHGRKAIFEVHLKPIKIDDSINVDLLARQTPGFSGADIANVCNEAALIAARKNNKNVGKQDFIDAVDRVIAGLEKKNKIITPREKKTIAFHEAGHATVSWLLEHASPLVKVTIVPRGRSLGAAWYLPDERQITTEEQMRDEVMAALGGRASEQITFNKISTGALSDLEKVTKQVYSMVVYYGLNKKIGNISYYDSSGQSEYSFQKPYSDKTAELIDMEVSNYVEKAYVDTVNLLSKHKDKLEQVANLLLEKEVIFKEDMETIFGKRTFERDLEREQEEKDVQEKRNNDKIKAKAAKEKAKKELEEKQKATLNGQVKPADPKNDSTVDNKPEESAPEKKE